MNLSLQFQIEMHRQLFRRVLLFGEYKKADREEYYEIRKSAKKINKEIKNTCLGFKERLQWELYIYWLEGDLMVHRLSLARRRGSE